MILPHGKSRNGSGGACTIVVASARDHVPAKSLDQQMTFLSQQYHGCFIRLDTLNIDISSRLIRQWLHERKAFGIMFRTVVSYIRENNIYLTSEGDIG